MEKRFASIILILILILFISSCIKKDIEHIPQAELEKICAEESWPPEGCSVIANQQGKLLCEKCQKLLGYEEDIYIPESELWELCQKESFSPEACSIMTDSEGLKICLKCKELTGEKPGVEPEEGERKEHAPKLGFKQIGKETMLLPTNLQTDVPKPTDLLSTFFTELPPDEVLSQTHATIMAMGAKTFERPEQKEEYLSYIKFFHDAGVEYTGFISIFDAPSLKTYESNPELHEARCIDSHGKEIMFEWEGIPWQCTNNPVWREFLLELAKTNVDYGVDGIHIDEWLGTYSAAEEADGCFCEYCMKGFREYLKEKYSTEELESLGIDNIDAFDYSAYNGQEQTLLSSDFLDFQMKSIKEFMHEFIGKIHAYARKHNKEIDISANVPGIMSNWLPIVDEIDYMMSEYSYEYPPEGRSIPSFKLARSLGKPLVTQPQTNNPALLQRPDLAALMKIYTAEAYAARGFVVVAYDLTAQTSEGWQYYNADVEELSSHYGFIHDNKQYYENLVSPSKIAVLYSLLSARKYWTADFYAVCNRLLDSHLQYDVLFAGDDNWMQDDLSLDQLNEYEVVILPNTPKLLDQQADLLLSYAEAGGNIVAFGQVGPKLMSFMYSRNIPSAEKFSSILNDLIQPNIQTNADENVVMVEYLNSETHSITIHLINYDYDINAQKMNSQKDISLNVLLSPEMVGKNLIVSYESPDWIDTKELDYTVSDESIEFQIPKLEFYGVVSIEKT